MEKGEKKEKNRRQSLNQQFFSSLQLLKILNLNTCAQSVNSLTQESESVLAVWLSALQSRSVLIAPLSWAKRLSHFFLHF